MIKLNKKETKAFAIRYFWSWYIYWIPTIITEYHPEDSVFCNLCISKNKERELDYKGAVFVINIHIFMFYWVIDFWWNLKKKDYAKRY